MKKWIAQTHKNKTVSEEEINWSYLEDGSIKSLKLEIDGQMIELPDNMDYVQGKTASAMLGASECEIVSRYIGFKMGNSIVKVRVDEKTNNINIEVE